MLHERSARAREAAEQRQQRLAAERRATAKLKQLRMHAALTLALALTLTLT